MNQFILQRNSTKVLLRCVRKQNVWLMVSEGKEFLMTLNLRAYITNLKV